MDRRRPVGGLPRTRSTFAEGFFQPVDHPPLRRNVFDKFQDTMPSYNRFRDGISDPSSRIFTDDDLMFFDNFPRRPFYADSEFFHAPMSREDESATFYQAQPRDRMPTQPSPLHQRSKSYYDNTSAPSGNYWEHRPFRHGEGDEQMPFDHQQDQQHFAHGQNHRQPAPNDPNVHVIKIRHEGRQPTADSNNGKKFVEINNSVPNYESLNPDKRRRRSSSSRQEDGHGHNSNHPPWNGGHGTAAQRRAPSIPNITIDDFSTSTQPNDAVADANDNDGKKVVGTAPIPLPAPAIPLPPPPNCVPTGDDVHHEQQPKHQIGDGQQQQSNGANMLLDQQHHQQQQPNATNVVVVVDDGTDAIGGGNGCDGGATAANFAAGDDDDLLQLLDKTEQLTEQFRENAIKLEQAKETILDKINSIKTSAGIKLTAAQFSQAERDGLLLNLERILARCNSVNISIETPRNQHQSKALEQVNKMITSVLEEKNGNGSAIRKIHGFLNACHPDEVGNIDEKFQSAIIECTADDQKKIRRKLANIVEQMNRSADGGKNGNK